MQLEGRETMIYKKLNGTSLEVSSVALGSALFGAAYDEAFSFGQMDLFVENGGNFIDTAHVYNDWIPGEKARSEKVIGRWIRARGMEGKVHVLSKCAHPPLDRMDESRVSRECVEQDLQESLENLQVSAIDLYLLHRDDPNVPIGKIVGWMNDAIDRGRIRHWGVSNWTLDRIRAANDYARANGLAAPVVNQTMWSFASIVQPKLDDQTLVPLDEAAYRYHCETGMNLMAFTSQAKGYFARLAAGEALPEGVRKPYDCPANAEKLAFLKACGAETGLDIAGLCLRFFDRQPFTAIPIVSYDTDAQLLNGLKAYSEAFTAALEGVEFPLVF